MKNTFLLFAFSLVFFFSSAQSNGTIAVGSESRTYTYFVPPTLPPQAPALVFVLHGTTQTGAGIMDISAFNDLAIAHNFIAVYPDGVGNIWNVGFDLPGASTADDLGFIEALVDLFVAEYGANPSKVYSCGFSAGGYMSHRLACESSKCFAAVASVSGTMSPAWGDTCSPSYSTSVMQIHGTSDLIVPYNGGTSTTGYSVDQVMAKWQTILGCDATTSTTDLPNNNLLDLSSVQRIDYAGCDANTDLVLLKVNSGGHMWPGTDVILSGIGTINRDISASEEIWNFFSNFQCPVGVNVAEHAKESAKYTIDEHHMLTLAYAPEQGLEYRVYDALGRPVLAGKTALSIDLSSLSNGVYIVQFGHMAPSKFVLH